MENQNAFEYRHNSVSVYFKTEYQQEMICLHKLRYYDATIDLLNEWLNDYTTLLNVWFCELLYFPTTTNNIQWGAKLYGKVDLDVKMSIPEIIQHFEIRTLQFDGVQLCGVQDLMEHLSQYVGLQQIVKGQELKKEALTGYRVHLTTETFANIKKVHKTKLTKELKPLYPWDASMLINPNHSLSYRELVADEENREDRIFDLLVNYDREQIRPLLVQKKYID